MIKDKKILITGVCGSIGAHLANHFLNDGLKVFGMDIKESSSGSIKSHHQFQYVSCDLSDGEAAVKAVDHYVEENGAVDVLINNVGLIFNSPLIRFDNGNLVSHSFADWNRVLSVSLSSAFYVSAACAKHWVAQQKAASIINISSICARGNPGQAAYSAAKAGLDGLTYALAKELGILGIRVVSIAPGFFDTDSTHSAVGEERLKRIRKSIPLQRLGQLGELTHAVEFVIENTYYTGTVLELNGGLVI